MVAQGINNMDALIFFLLVIFSLFILFQGASLALGGAEKIGSHYSLPPFLIGMALVGLGTSLPEFFVCHIALFNGESEMAMGNILGSNVANFFFILGIVGVLRPISLAEEGTYRELLYYLVLLVIFLPFALMKHYGFIAAFTLIAFSLIYFYRLLKSGGISKELKLIEEKLSGIEKVPQAFPLKALFFFLLGLVLLYGGGEVLIFSGTKLAAIWGISPYVISTLLFALGTSFPELMTSILAIKKESGAKLVLGNLLGSNIFNLSFVLGTSALHRFSLESSYILGSSLLLFGALFILFCSKQGIIFSRRSGIFFIFLYSLFVGATFYS